MGLLPDSHLFQSSSPKFKLTENSIKVLQTRYLKKDKTGKACETPEELFRRVARTAAVSERLYGDISNEDLQIVEEQFYRMIGECYFQPNSPTLMNAGREMGMLSACFVLPIEDSIEGIFDSIKNTALIQKAGGGTGFSFSRLRPRGDRVNSSGGTTSGPMSFLKVFSGATEAIQQGAFRRGANMGVMRIDHPDIIEFIEAKRDLTRFTNYNLSVSISDRFMEKLRSDPGSPHMVVNPRNKESFPLKRADGTFWSVSAIWLLILERAWESGEPGILFFDRINQYNPTPHIGEMEATNPCGEQPLLPYEACNLGSINLGKFVETREGKPYFNFHDFREVIRISTRFLDNIIDANNYPLQQIHEICTRNRKIGLGVMGFADALFKLYIPYDSEEGIAFGEKIMEFLQKEAHQMSEELSEERGTFPNWKGSRWELEWKREMRNACVTTVAPTGTISIIANCSGGIEPMFSLAFYRNILDGQRLPEMNEVFADVAKKEGFYSEALIRRIAEEGTIQHIEEIPEPIRRIFVTARDIHPKWHLRMQAAFQKNCDSSISKTINFDHSASKEDIKTIYDMAFDLKLKGVTIYRDGSRQNQPMALESSQKKEEKPKEILSGAMAPVSLCTSVPTVPVITPTPLKPIKLPDIMNAFRIRQVTPFGNMHIQVSVDVKSGKEREVFAQLGKGGDVAYSDLEAICRLLSLFLRCNGELSIALQQLDGIGSSLSIPSKEGRIQSLADGLAKGLQKYLNAKEMFGLEAILLGNADISKLAEEKMEKKTKNHILANAFKLKCPECSGNLTIGEGCVVCHGCGFSKC